MIEPKEIEIDGITFILSKFPATAGRRIAALYPTSALPKVGDYELNEQTMYLLMKYVAVRKGDMDVQLTTQSLIDNHVGSFETLLKVEWAMMEYNCSFFQNGRISNFLEDFAQKLPTLILEMWTTLSQQLSAKEKQP